VWPREDNPIVQLDGSKCKKYIFLGELCWEIKLLTHFPLSAHLETLYTAGRGGRAGDDAVVWGGGDGQWPWKKIAAMAAGEKNENSEKS
jgi:hypothetical protein